MTVATGIDCRVCGENVGRRGWGNHVNMHKREFEDTHGREPRDWEEVVAQADVEDDDDQHTLFDYVDE